MSEIKISFDIAELKVISLKPGDVLSVTLTGDDYAIEAMNKLRKHIQEVFPDNKIMVFSIQHGDELKIEAIRPEEA